PWTSLHALPSSRASLPATSCVPPKRCGRRITLATRFAKTACGVAGESDPDGHSSLFGEQLANSRDHLGPVQLDVLHEPLVRQRASRILQVEAIDVQRADRAGDLLSHRLWRAHVPRSMRNVGFE